MFTAKVRFARGCGALLVAAVMTATAAFAEPLTIGHSTWVGYGPFYIAQEKGFFEEEGIEVELVKMEDIALQMGALAADQIQVAGATPDVAARYYKSEIPLKMIFALDNSKGADGVVADDDIKTIADLKGKQVALDQGSVSQFYLNVLLRQAGLTQEDIDAVNMTATDAAFAFTAGRLDAAVTWQPHLSQAAQREGAHLLTTSADNPGVIVDTPTVRADVFEARKSEFEALYRAWNRAVDFWKENPDEAHAIMAAGVGGWLDDPAVWAETLQGVELLGEEGNRALFGTKENPGPIHETTRYAIEILGDLGQLQANPTPDDLLSYKLVGQ